AGRYEGDRKDLIAWDLRCVDPTWLLNRTKVLINYPTPLYASDIIADLMNRFSRIGAMYIQTGTAIIDAITFTNEDLPACLTAICERIGAAWYLDYQNQLHVFLDEAVNATPIDDTHARSSHGHALAED